MGTAGAGVVLPDRVLKKRYLADKRGRAHLGVRVFGQHRAC